MSDAPFNNYIINDSSENFNVLHAGWSLLYYIIISHSECHCWQRRRHRLTILLYFRLSWWWPDRGAGRIRPAPLQRWVLVPLKRREGSVARTVWAPVSFRAARSKL